MTSSIIFLKPILGKNGFEYWTVGSWNKENVSVLVKKIRKIKGVQIWLMGIKEEPVDVFLPNVFSRLSKKQLSTVKKAMSSGYYSYPRKISLEKLAKLDGLNESTFREHLRKAEAKIMEATMVHSP